MTVASLVVDLRANAASFHEEMDKAARHIETLGRHITRAGTEITKLFSPIAVLYAAALTAAVKQSALVHGQLAQQWDRLTLSARLLVREIGAALTPAFERMIASKEQLIQKARQLVEWFKNLSPSTQDLIIKVGFFLAVLGPTVLIIGQVVRAAGALYFVFSQLAGVIAAAVGPALAFLVSPAGLITLAILGIAAAVFLLIRHWQLAKQVAAIEWQEIKALVLDAALGILTALTMIPAGTPIFGGLGEAASAAIPKIIALRDTVQQAAGQMISSLKMDKPLLPDWMMHPIDALKNLFHFSLPTIQPLPIESFLVAQDILAKLNTTLGENAVRAQLLGSSFNRSAADASAYKVAVDALVAAHIPLNAILDWSGRSLESLAKQYKDVSAAAELWSKITQAVTNAVSNVFVTLGEDIGKMFAGVSHGFHNFGAQLMAIIGGMLKQIGAAAIAVGLVSIAFGTAGAAIKLFAENPLLAIAAGTALVALGQVFASKAQGALDSSLSGSAPATAAGGGGGASAPGQGSGTIVLEVRGRALDFRDPYDLDALAQALRDLSGRNVVVVPAMG